MENLKIKAPIHSFESMGASDGPGIRAIIFLQGCVSKCLYCHNPDSIVINNNNLHTSEEIFEKIKKLKPYIKNGGVTISGGEPLLHPAFCSDLIKLCKNENLHTAIDTSGFCCDKKHLDTILEADLILLDIKSADSSLCKKITGLDNKNPVKVLDFCEQNNKPIWIRHVVVPSLTFEENQIKELGNLLKKYHCIKKIQLLPFHQLGKHKWEDLNLPYLLADTPALTQEQLSQAYQWLEGSLLTANSVFDQNSLKNIIDF